MQKRIQEQGLEAGQQRSRILCDCKVKENTSGEYIQHVQERAVLDEGRSMLRP